MDIEASLDPQLYTSRVVDASPFSQCECAPPEVVGFSATEPCTPPSSMQSTLPARAVSIGPIQVDCARNSIAFNGRSIHLSRLDCALLLALGKNPNRVLSYPFIMRQVWGRDHKVTTTGLRVRVFHLRNKLEALRVNGIRIRNKDRLGYVMEIDEPRDRVSHAQLVGRAIAGARVTVAKRHSVPRSFATAAE